MPRMNYLLCIVPIILFGEIGGFFYAYSVSVMQGLNNLADVQAIHAMQELNRGTRNGLFLFTFLCTPILTLGCAIMLYLKGRHGAGLLLLAAAVVYFCGSFLPTVSINVPMNHAIEAIDIAVISMEDAAKVWASYSADWTFWNTVRALMALVSLGLAGGAMYSVGRHSA